MVCWTHRFFARQRINLLLGLVGITSAFFVTLRAGFLAADKFCENQLGACVLTARIRYATRRLIASKKHVI